MILTIISFFSIFEIEIPMKIIPYIICGHILKYLFIFLINENITFEAKIKLYKKTITITQFSFNYIQIFNIV